jgi:hypothetical protein
MNIVTPIPNSFGYPTNSVGTDSVRRDNVQREAIPSVTQGDKSAAEKGLGNDGDRNNQSANQANLLQNPTYDRPTTNQSLAENFNGGASKDNANEQSAGKESAESKQEQQQQQRDDKKVAELKDRDREVRIHEQAHAATGGQYAGAPTYEYETGPDNKRYAVGGEVSIDVSNENSPAETIRKMQQVKAAALAPAEPSPQDYKVASDAAQKEQSARSELVKEQAADDENEIDSAANNNLDVGENVAARNSIIQNQVSDSASIPSSLIGDSGTGARPQSESTVTGEANQILKAGSGLSEQAQKTGAVVSGFYAGIAAQSQSSINFSV